MYISHTVHPPEYRPGVEGCVGPESGPFRQGSPGFQVPRAQPRTEGYMCRWALPRCPWDLWPKGEGVTQPEGVWV